MPLSEPQVINQRSQVIATEAGIPLMLPWEVFYRKQSGERRSHIQLPLFTFYLNLILRLPSL